MIKVLVMGTFDLTHAGHFDLFQKAKALGDHLTVGIGHDKLNRVFKGEGRPIYPAACRFLIIKGCRYVDEVYTYGDECPDDYTDGQIRTYNHHVQVKLIEHVKPDIFAQGIDNAKPILEGVLEDMGIERVWLPRLSHQISASYYIEKIKNLP